MMESSHRGSQGKRDEIISLIVYINKLVMSLCDHKVINFPEKIQIDFSFSCSHFSYFNKDENMTDMRDQSFYMFDSFGLRSLDKAGRVKIYEVPGVHHTVWHHNVSVIENCILPWLD